MKSVILITVAALVLLAATVAGMLDSFVGVGVDGGAAGQRNNLFAGRMVRNAVVTSVRDHPVRVILVVNEDQCSLLSIRLRGGFFVLCILSG